MTAPLSPVIPAGSPGAGISVLVTGLIGNKDSFLKNKTIKGEKINMTFDTVAGLQNAKKDLQEIVDFLKNILKKWLN